MGNLAITGVGMYVPERIMTNEEIENLGIGANAKWIYENTGIMERRIAQEKQYCSDLAVLAAQEAISNATITPEDIDLIVMGTFTPDYLAPHTAAVVKQKLKASRAACFDVQAGCAGGIYGLINAVNYSLCNSEVNNILVIGADVASRAVDWSDRKSCSILADGAGAFIVQRIDGHYGIEGQNIFHTTLEDTSYACMPLYYGLNAHNSAIYYKSEGRYIYNILKGNIPIIIEKLLRQVKWRIDDVDMFILPQVNKNLIGDVLSELNISEHKTHMIMNKYGYTSNSCIFIAVYDALKCNKISKGDKVILAAAGAGNYFASIALKWAF